MQQKNIWIGYLIFGLIITSSWLGCSKKEYRSQADIKYVNQTNHNVVCAFISSGGDTLPYFSVPPLSDTTFVMPIIGPELTSSDEVGRVGIHHFYDNLQNDYLFSFDNEKCLLFKKNGKNVEGSVMNVKSYETEKLEGFNHYLYTYTIINAHYEAAEDCN